MNGGPRRKGGGSLGKPSFMPRFESKVSRGELTQAWEREGGVKRGSRNNSKQALREKTEDERQTALLLWGKESRCEAQMTANRGRGRSGGGP